MATPTPLTASALESLSLSGSSRLTLSGDTPCPTPPLSDYDAETQCGSRPPSPEPKKKGSIHHISSPQKGGAHEAVQQEFVEGGRDGYLTLLGATLVLLSCFGFSNSFGTFFAHYQKDQLSAYPSSTITWIGSLHLFIVFGSALLSGRGFDLGYFKWQLRAGSLLWVFGLLMLSLSTTFVQILLSQSVCLGLALGCMFGPVLSSVGTYFKKKRGICIGIAASGAAIGAIMYPILCSNLFPSLGFGPTVRITAYISAGLLLAANLLIRPRPLPKREPVPIRPLLRSFTRQASMWLCCFGVFGGVLGVFIIMFFISVYTKAHTKNAVLAQYSLPILNGCAVLGRLSIGVIADRVGPFTTIIPCTTIMGGMIFALLGCTSTYGTILFLLVFGITSGGFISVMASCFMSLSSDMSEIGVRNGCGFLFVALASLIGSPIAGAILAAAGGNYLAPCLFAGLSTLTGALLLTASRRTQVARHHTWRV